MPGLFTVDEDKLDELLADPDDLSFLMPTDSPAATVGDLLVQVSDAIVGPEGWTVEARRIIRVADPDMVLVEVRSPAPEGRGVGVAHSLYAVPAHDLVPVGLDIIDPLDGPTEAAQARAVLRETVENVVYWANETMDHRTRRETGLFDAVTHMADVFADAAGFDTEMLRGLTCNEVESVAKVFDAAGRADAADAMRVAHGDHDDEGDLHWGFTEDNVRFLADGGYESLEAWALDSDYTLFDAIDRASGWYTRATEDEPWHGPIDIREALQDAMDAALAHPDGQQNGREHGS